MSPGDGVRDTFGGETPRLPQNPKRSPGRSRLATAKQASAGPPVLRLLCGLARRFRLRQGYGGQVRSGF